MVRRAPTAEQIDQLHSAIILRLKARGDRVVAEAQSRYMKGVVLYHGIKTPELRSLIRQFAYEWNGWGTDALKILAGRLLRSSYFEEKDWAITILKSIRSDLDGVWLSDLADQFQTLVPGWAVCDALCSQVFRYLLPQTPLRTQIIAWKDSPVPWLQRAAAVAFVNEARHGNYNDEIFTVCRATVRNPHRFVQLGTGWVLRELSLADRPAVTRFLHDHRTRFSAEGLRYALEKYPSDER